MATTQTANATQALAMQLSCPHVLTQQELLFREALSLVEKERKQQADLPDYFNNLFHAQSIDDVRLALKLERESNRFWSKDVGQKWLKHLGQFAERVWYYKVIVDAAVTRNTELVTPIWGVLQFFMNVVKDFEPTRQQLGRVEYTLEQSVTRFGEYFEDGRTLSVNFRSAVTRYYIIVIDFAIDTHKEFRAGRKRTIFNTVHRTLKAKMDEVEKIIRPVIDDVDKGGELALLKDMRQEARDNHVHVRYALVNATGSASVTRPTTQSATPFGLPQPHDAFTGRTRYLRRIWELFQNGSATAQIHTVLHGMAGIGKTQILQRYAHDRLRDTVKQAYEWIIYINSHDASAVLAAVTSFMHVHASTELLQKPVNEEDYTSFHTWLLSRDHWLLIFDNVSNYNHIQKALPNGHRGHLLFSTRYVSIANQLAPKSNRLEILPMERNDSITLIQALSNGSIDATSEAAVNVADFAKDLPLVIDQIVNNAVFGSRSLETTLQSVTEKAALLRQRNISTLHEHTLSLGGVLLDAFDTIERTSLNAKALLAILAYFEPSSMSVTLLRDGAKQYHAFLQRPYTYTRGAANHIHGELQERYDSIQMTTPGIYEQGHKKRWRPDGLVSRWRLRKQGDHRSHSDLPVDDALLNARLLAEFGPNTPTGRLFENTVMIDNAITVLCDISLVRRTDASTLWMHDLVSEVAKALLASQSRAISQDTALTAAITVYLAFPLPGDSMQHKRRIAFNKCLPHAISCCNSLAELGILNDCSIGPELCHLIASSISINGAWIVDSAGTPEARIDEVEHLNRMVKYYVQAYEGYKAGWKRLKVDHEITDEQILSSTCSDREREDRLGYSPYWHWYGIERYGRSAPWRAAQTASKLCHLYEQQAATVGRAILLTKELLVFYEAAFGTNDLDTSELKQDLFRLLGPVSEDWQAAYDFNMKCIYEFVYWRPKQYKYDLDEFDALCATELPGQFARQAGVACIELSKMHQRNLDVPNALLRAKEAPKWAAFLLRQRQRRYKQDDDFYHRGPMMELANAYEVANDFHMALYWYGRATVCTLRFEEGSSVLRDNDESMLKMSEVFDSAKARLLDSVTGRDAGQLINDKPLLEFLDEVNAKVAFWRVSYEPRARLILEQTAVVEKFDWDEILAQPFEPEDQGSGSQTEVEPDENKDKDSPPACTNHIDLMSNQDSSSGMDLDHTAELRLGSLASPN